MKIRRIAATPINLPLEAPYVWVFGELPGFSLTIVEVETEDGLVGLGEAPTWLAASIIRDHIAGAGFRYGWWNSSASVSATM